MAMPCRSKCALLVRTSPFDGRLALSDKRSDEVTHFAPFQYGNGLPLPL